MRQGGRKEEVRREEGRLGGRKDEGVVRVEERRGRGTGEDGLSWWRREQGGGSWGKG